MNSEITTITHLAREYPRRGDQLNRIFECDVEVIPCEDGFLCSTVDTISEELSMGLVQDVKSQAWLTITASASDLAAAGAVPLQFSCQIGATQAWRQQFETIFLETAREASQYYGGELTEVRFFETEKLMTSCAAIGWSKTYPKQRLGLRPGDQLYLTGPVGWGNAVAFANLALRPKAPAMAQALDVEYRPKARTDWRELLAEFAGAVLDTSDGLLFSLDLYQQLNPVGLEVHYRPELFHPVALKVAQSAHVNPWLFFAAQNGEFELLFSIPKSRIIEFERRVQIEGRVALHVGQVVEDHGLFFRRQDLRQKIDISELRNLLHDRVDPAKYIQTMLAFAAQERIEFQETDF